MNCGSIAD